jgi:hypothetical protein
MARTQIENTLLRRVFGPEVEEVMRVRRKHSNEGFQKLVSCCRDAFQVKYLMENYRKVLTANTGNI